MNELMISLMVLNGYLNGLIVELNHNEFNRREAASQTLLKMTPYSDLHVEVTTADNVLEVRHRADRLKVDINYLYTQTMCDTIMPTKFHTMPWIDMLPSDYPNREAIIRHNLEMAKLYITESQVTPAPSSWWNYRVATKVFVRELLLAGKKPCEIIKILDSMVSNEQAWWTKNHQNANIIETRVLPRLGTPPEPKPEPPEIILIGPRFAN